MESLPLYPGLLVVSIGFAVWLVSTCFMLIGRVESKKVCLTNHITRLFSAIYWVGAVQLLANQTGIFGYLWIIFLVPILVVEICGVMAGREISPQT